VTNKKNHPKKEWQKKKVPYRFNFSPFKRIPGRRYIQATTIGKDSKEINIKPLHNHRYTPSVRI
jgi:hypothetical protein